MRKNALPLILLAALLLWLLFGKHAIVTSKVTDYQEAVRCPYWIMEGDSWEGGRGEHLPVIRDMWGMPLASPPEPPWSSCFA